MSPRRCLAAAKVVSFAAALTIGLVAATAAAEIGADPDLAQRDARAVARETRRALENGRALWLEGRHEAAERVLRRGLKQSQNDPALDRALAHVLDSLDRPDEALALRARADARDPRPAPLPKTPLVPDASAVSVLLVRGASPHPDRPGDWPDDEVRERLANRVARRLPGAGFRPADPESVAEAERLLRGRAKPTWVSLRVGRVFCGFSVKDGQIAVAELEAVAKRPGQGPVALPVRRVVVDPLPREGCALQALDRALEAALGAGIAREGGDPIERSAARALFPGLDRRITAWVRKGRSQLASGELEAAERSFEAALEVDPQDPIARSFRDEVRASRALAQALAREHAPDAGDRVDPRLSAEQRAAAEIALRRERTRRDELMAALAVLDEDVVRPSDAALARLRRVEIPQPDAFGPRLARERVGGPISARAAYAPNGDVIARYYFAERSEAPVLREEDTRGDGTPDRWITYRGTARHEIFEDRSAHGRPDLRLVFAEAGEPLERIEVDRQRDGTPDHVLRYRNGALIAESADTDGDGRLDRFDRFDAEGRVGLREEDLNGDGEVDVRSEYVAGKLVRREISTPEHLPES